jgi:Fic family protein
LRRYIHQLPDWPAFTWNHDATAGLLATVNREQGRLLGRMESLGFPQRQRAVLEALTADVLKSSEIEGEKLDPEQVRSSIARRLGMEIAGLPQTDRHIEGIVEMMLDATRNYQQPLTGSRLFAWHAALFPTGRSGMTKIRVGAWRDDRSGPMRVVSGPMGHEKIHYEAPPAKLLKTEMSAFMHWFNRKSGIDPVPKAAVAHLWFVTIHPFDDGNGRIGRAIADISLARAEETPQRFYSMSAQIREERKDYYDILEQTQRGTMDITPWLEWFLGCLYRAISRAHSELGAVLAKARYWQAIQAAPLNVRQRMMLSRLIDGFEGNLTTAKWAKIAKCSHDTALRDIRDLVQRGMLVQNPAGGRSTSYALGAT